MTARAVKLPHRSPPFYVDRVGRHHERVVVSRNGKPAAVLMSLADLESLEETLDPRDLPRR
ncbi:MAG: type II toxin-antitoxin system Phd/YefM family antitoxin [Acidimicrobiia bacterium]|nr:type II toxin-antitoxin system Phd/YefM family antitoxin [Acidimicrobiia bacterium]